MIGPDDRIRASRLYLDDEELAVVSLPLPRPRTARLSHAESEIVILLARGYSNAEIARQRGRSERTIANQVASILRKLGVRSRTEATASLVDLSPGRPGEAGE